MAVVLYPSEPVPLKKTTCETENDCEQQVQISGQVRYSFEACTASLGQASVSHDTCCFCSETKYCEMARAQLDFKVALGKGLQLEVHRFVSRAAMQIFRPPPH